MKNAVLAAALLAGFAVANPLEKRQEFDFGAILNAPSPSATQPDLTATQEIKTIDAASVQNSVEAIVTTEATASITGSSAAAAATIEPTVAIVDRRDLDKRQTDLLSWLFGWVKPKVTTTSTKKTTAKSTAAIKTTAQQTTPKQTTAQTTAKTTAKTTAQTTAVTTAPATTEAPTATTKEDNPSLSTDQFGNVFTSDPACPKPYEIGTFCGFVNPQDYCIQQPDGYGPKVEPDTPEAFLAYKPFSDTAQNAATPAGYDVVFKDLDGAVSANSYLGLHTLKSYDTQACAARCDESELCTAFNVYIERNPSLNVNFNETDPDFDCPNPPSITNYKCTLWGSEITPESATNKGGWRLDFEVVITGSNGYDKTEKVTPPELPNWSKPENCHQRAITSGGSYHLGSKFFPGPFDTKVCKFYAEAQHQKNKAEALSKGRKTFTPCNMFNAYSVRKNGKGQGTYCSLYNTKLSVSWANWGGSWAGNDRFDCGASWNYALTKQDSGDL